METFECAFCAKTYPADPFHTFCPTCKEPLLVVASKKEKAVHFDRVHPLEIWQDFLPLSQVNHDLSLGEGNTPLIRLKNIERNFRLPTLYAKNETVNPTFSFKDRGTAVAVQKAIALGIQKIGTVSTGNMAASTAAYGAKARLRTFVLVKEDTPEIKLRSIGLHRAVIVRVKGDYGELFRKSLDLAPRTGIYFMNSVDPFRIEGYKVTGLEIFRQIDRKVPDYLFVPVSAGGHLVGIIRAFQDLKRGGFIENYPHFIGVQAAGCSPVAQAFAKGLQKVNRITKAQTIAHAISNPDPPAGNLLLQLIREIGGTVMSVPDDQILEAQHLLAEYEGLFVQPASATTLSGAMAFAKQHKLAPTSKSVLVLTGSGMKAPVPNGRPDERILQADLSELPSLIESVSRD